MHTVIKKNAPQYKANLHCHSNISDGKFTPAELKEVYKSNGYSVLAITDHEAPFDHSDLTDSDFLMISGYEAYIRPDPSGNYNIYNPEVHINLFAREPHNTPYIGWNESYCKYVKDPALREAFVKPGSHRQREYTLEYINEFLRTAKENGYICAHNHAYWSMEDPAMIAAYEGFFSMEMFNYSSYTLNQLEYNAQLYDRLMREGKRIFCHSTDDNHNKHPFGDPACDSFGGFTMILSDELTYPSVIAALEKGDFYSSMGPVINELTFDGGKVHVETSPAKQITMFFGAKRTCRAVGSEDAPVTVGDFEIPEGAKYVRISVHDFNGRYADTRGYFRDEFEQW